MLSYIPLDIDVIQILSESRNYQVSEVKTYIYTYNGKKIRGWVEALLLFEVRDTQRFSEQGLSAQPRKYLDIKRKILQIIVI